MIALLSTRLGFRGVGIGARWAGLFRKGIKSRQEVGWRKNGSRYEFDSLVSRTRYQV